MSKKVERTAKRNGQRAQGLGRCRIPTYLLTSFVLSAAVILPYMSPTMLRLDVNSESSKGVYVPGPGMRPQLMFACCNQGKEALSALLADPSVFADLKELHAGLAIPIDELSPDRAQLVHRLNEAGIPASAWIVLPGEQGYYVNASNAPQTARWFAEFEKWSRENNLHWNAVGLDIEPDFREFQWSKWRLAWTLLRRGFDSERVNGPRQAYAALIHEMQVRGYRVQTCQFIFLADERKVHSTILERLFGLVDVRGDEEVLMTYTTFNHKAGAAMVWSYGQDTQALVVGSTLGSGNAAIDAKYGPLNWEEFSRDTIVASHFSREVGVYSLEGCVRQGFLLRLKTKDWNQGVEIPAAALARMHRFRAVVQGILWTASHLLYFATAFLIVVIWLVLLRIRRKHAARGTSTPSISNV
ncbi:MAG: hypothetical protein WA715_01070 [Candidatus Acidiferrum sp.]